jgi:hypothetical protein
MQILFPITAVKNVSVILSLLCAFEEKHAHCAQGYKAFLHCNFHLGLMNLAHLFHPCLTFARKAKGYRLR